MAYLSVDIDLDDIRDDDLLDEVERRGWSDREQMRLLEIVKSEQSQKMTLFMQVMDRFTFVELEELFKEKFDHTSVPKEQLELPLIANP